MSSKEKGDPTLRVLRAIHARRTSPIGLNIYAPVFQPQKGFDGFVIGFIQHPAKSSSPSPSWPFSEATLNTTRSNQIPIKIGDHVVLAPGSSPDTAIPPKSPTLISPHYLPCIPLEAHETIAIGRYWDANHTVAFDGDYFIAQKLL